MQQILLRAALSLLFIGSALQAQSSDGMKSKGDSMPNAMSPARMKDRMARSTEHGMDKQPMMKGDAMDGMGGMGRMGEKGEELRGALVGTVGHRASGRVWVSSNGEMRTIALDSTFAISGGNGSGLYLSENEQFDMSATRVGALSKEMGAQKYTVRLARGGVPRHLLIVNESSHAVLARASLGDAMHK